MSDMSNLTLIANKLSHNESQTDTLTERPFSQTCVSSYSPVQPSSIEELRTWLLEAFPASHSQLPESKQAQTMPEICGLQQPTLFAQSDLPAFSWKTYQDYSSSTTPKVFSLTLPKWGMWDATALYPLPTAVLDTDDSDCGLLEREPDGVNFHHTPNTSGMDGGSNSRRALAKRQANWPSPTCSDVYTGSLKSTQQKPGSMHSVTLPQDVAMWPTPAAGLSKGGVTDHYFDHRIENGRQEDVAMAVYKNGDGAVLNPDWTEWLMGWVVGWSDLKPLPELTWCDWKTDPADTGEVLRVTDVKENRANRLKAIGNGQVPQCVVKAWELLA